jgi:serine phosphatase RsbU (regulator of sigma subunit)
VSKSKSKKKKQAVNRGIPKFYGLRIYLTSTFLFFMLVIPFLLFLGYRSIPEINEKRNLFGSDTTGVSDSLMLAIDSLSNMQEADIDSIVNKAILLGESYAQSEAETRSLEEADSESDTLSSGGPRVQVSVNKEEEADSPFEEEGFVPTYFKLLFTLLLAAFLAGLIYNIRFKRYFKFKRQGREIPEKTQRYCKKHLLNTPVVNSLILTAPNIFVLLYALFFVILPGKFEEEFQRQMFIQLNYLSLLASLLEFLFVYYWQKHRVHIRYIEHLYTEEELRVQVFKRKGGKIRNRFLVASGMTTFLPLVVVMAYLILSLTSIEDLELENFNKDQREILIGPWSSVVNADQETVSAEKYQKLFYVNAFDSIVMMVGIGNGILVSLIYLLLFIRWTSRDISRPVKDLLTSMRNTRGGGTEQYTIVRTNDEIGELAEGYNEMTQKIHAYVENISKMNQELEEKVKERTREVVEQKEEIEAQKEEIEAQLDLATLQRDTILNQKDLILDSIRYAERIQSAILSPLSHLSDQLADHFILFKPRDIVSGDFYWTTQQDDKILLAVADCTGHGVPGAFLSVLGISSMNEIVKQNGGLSASDILEKLRNFIIKSLHQTGSKGETQDGIEIALCILDIKKRTMEYAGANRPVYIVSGDSVQHIKPDRMPIGIYDYQVRPFTNHKLKLKKNDSVYLFSDGYVDQLGGPLRKTFRSRRFRKLLLEIREKSMSDQKQILMDTLKEWQGEVEQIDDILVMGIRV